ncbi:rhomboid family intramembrane serine protease [Namhaeicola litoreus]|uniref:Rhomboid family intramembrane serine protease n=1 Tax=Namhaeicola litoreus TaxID=1052145 RepID=A0ABW3Y4M0_9FLAO
MSTFKFSPMILAVPLYFVLFLWIVYWFELKFGVSFNKYGILPRDFMGLRGIVFGPFIHKDVNHLYNNSVPLFLFMLSLWFFYRDVALKIFIYGMICLGFLTWLIGRKSYHIGASGVVYMLFSFIFFSGIFRKYYRLIAVSLAIIFLYGSMVWYILPIEENVSWEGHLSGFLVGLVFAWIFRNEGPQRNQFSWEIEEGEVEEGDERYWEIDPSSENFTPNK